MSANLVATSNGALDMLANGTGSVNGSVNGIINQPIDQFAHNGRIVEEEAEDGEEPREIDINLQNVVCTFRTGCHLNLRTIATNGANVQYNRARSVVSMKLRKPKITASIWSSGKIVCIGATSEQEAKIGARKIARILQKMSFKVKFCMFEVVNVFATVSFPFGIKLIEFAKENRPACLYEPEISQSAEYKFSDFKATLTISHTGNLTIFAPNVRNVDLAVRRIFSLVYMHKKDKTEPGPPHRSRLNGKRKAYDDGLEEDDEEDEMLVDSPAWKEEHDY